ncbi:MAG: hypothetical protein CMB82_07215 [Flammeovirgaceae bacterium]|nr:hypothetical protein [Flammeovirgaceae bacterium]|tara:strand:- start:129 stop:536 length:408 start_codon:yes stop_codon:yes gene_type:complete
MENGFAIFGIRLSVITVAYGTFLLLWGVLVSLFTDSHSITSWIPSFIGIPILLGGTMSLVKPEQTKLWMHVAMVFGVITFIGGLDFLRGLGNDGGPFSNIAAGTSKLMLLVTGLAYSGACLASFIQVRRNRQAKE